ncbi:hypothetical protein MTO96_010150 [Rhipicephalus appendiculatus]
MVKAAVRVESREAPSYTAAVKTSLSETNTTDPCRSATSCAAPIPPVISEIPPGRSSLHHTCRACGGPDKRLHHDPPGRSAASSTGPASELSSTSHLRSSRHNSEHAVLRHD